ncbi:hypothetical protein VTO42DRAFT_7324 [Malbranchea cinnamomea]
METNIPEGLQHQSVETIASWIASAGFNCVRLTYSIDMALNPDIPVSTSFEAAAQSAGVPLDDFQAVYRSAVDKNPFLANATTLGTFGAVVDALAAENVLVILDNHVSRASWCCSMTDGNGWWDSAAGYNEENSRYFNTEKWLDGLRRMATWAADHPNVVGMALRNELRAAEGQDGNDHEDWYRIVPQGCDAIHSRNNNLLIVIGGVAYATNFDFLGRRPFDRSPYPNKIVYEFHTYSWSQPINDCASYRNDLGRKAGYLLTQNREYTGPLWLSEFGYQQVDTPADHQQYIDCLVEYMESNDAEWAYWALQGSYYARNGNVNDDEGFGLLNFDWSDWRNEAFVGQLGRMWEVTQGP